MTLFLQFARYATAFRDFVSPSYRPERHYMRGPGPACARRVGEVVSSRASFH
ncbi:MAG: hypothetical protein M9944_19795 [Rhizobiaceae bacterium]|nr:hypothetical protein [Rhizobiaceae bacterium]